MGNNNVIYTRDIAAKIVERFEDVLSSYDISVPSPEDDDRGEDNMVSLYGSTYYDLLDEVEDDIIKVIDGTKIGKEVVSYTFSGRM